MGTMAGSVEEIGAAAAAPQALELHAVQHLGELRSAFESGRTRPLEWRQDQLRGLLRLLANKEEEAFWALHDDLGKHRAEVGVIIKSANAALREIGKWVAPEKVWVPLVAFPASAQVVPEPLGVVLIFSCWNFPLAGEHRRSQRGRADEEKLVRRSLEVRRDCAWTCTQPGGQRCKPRLHRDCRCLGAPCGNMRSPTLSRSSSLLPGRQRVDGWHGARWVSGHVVLAKPQQQHWPSPLDDNTWTGRRGAGWVPGAQCSPDRNRSPGLLPWTTTSGRPWRCRVGAEGAVLARPVGCWPYLDSRCCQRVQSGNLWKHLVLCENLALVDFSLCMN